MSCVKVRYRDAISAKLALARAQRKDSPRRPKVERRVYRCAQCHGWHLTSEERKP